MTGAPVRVHIGSFNNGIDSKMCTNITNFKGGEWNDFKCTEQVSGRYVTVFLPETSNLILCEVKIYGKRKDLINTTNSITSQSSNYRAHGVSYSSGRATDGNETLCANTNDEQKPWWRIDLLGVYNISGISIYNVVGDNTNMDGAQIRVGNSRENNGINNKMCTKIKNFNRGQWNDFPCTKQVSGRYVTVSFPDKKALILCEVEIYGKKRDPINTANSITSQSSNYTADVSYSSGRATDGNKTACAHTEDKQKPWWRIDLLGFYDISGISIYNTKRTHTNMTGAQIHVGNSRENNGINNKMCTEIENFKGGEWNDFRCTEHVSGRYVTVSLPGERHLILCEVEIYGKKRDLINTTNSITSQSSNYTNTEGVPYSSGRATDGNVTACAHTIEMEAEHWWRIDLLGVYNISRFSMYNKKTHNTNITGAQIHIGNSRENNGTNNKICTNITNFEGGQWNDFKCTEQVSGRYVTVFLPGTRSLILCEVEIYGKRKASPFKLIKEKKTWEHALEYCRGNDMDLATILDEDDQTLAELEARRADTPFLWLGLHYTCILEVWFWVADYRLEFNRWADGEKTGDCDRSAVMERSEGHKWFSKSDYDEFNFICQKF
uniref:C-type lectin domain-containing protein n=1 Tax=Sparus aurata TaxID=8175 RepID=A0A671Z2U3_SPAAU